MGALIDTSTLIAAERGALDLDGLLSTIGDEPVAMSAITASELLHGVHRLKGLGRARAERFVETLIGWIPIAPFDLAAARVHASLSAELAERGTAVGAHDLIIASTAVSIGYDVATRDVRSFPRIRGLRVLRW